VLGDAGFCSSLEQYFMDITVSCPYGLEQKAVYHQARFTALPDEVFEQFLAGGYRRNGNYVYCMRCHACKSCVPIRVRPEQFEPNRSQRRIMIKNKDFSVGIAPMTMTRENLDLLDRFLASRFPESKSSAAGYYSGFFLGSLTRSFEIRYRVKDRLIGVAIIDCSNRWINAVYFYFDPEEAHRSPGTYNILYLIDFCRLHGIEMLYMGYCIDKVSAMSYKANFKPHELLLDGKWQQRYR
jgi:arginine-tRNA-protein transferase